MKKLVYGILCAAVALCAASAWAENGCWTRVRFQKLNSGGKDLQLSELALYNWQGERVNSPLTVVADGTVATNLAVGQATGYVEGGANRTFSGSYESLSQLFDNSTGSKMYRIANVKLDPETESTWIVITMRLAANAKPQAYNFATANDSVGTRSPTGWIVECSTNGVDWTVADTRANIAWPTTTFTWWNGGDSYPLDFDWDAFRVSYTQSEVYYAASNTPKPVPVVVAAADPTVTLSEGVDYTVSYSNWNQLGTATATVTGIGAYEGSENIYKYTVLPVFEVELSSTVVTNDLVHPYLPSVIVRSAETHAILTEDVHYRLEYVDPTGFDAAKVNVIGIGNYVGNELSLDFTIIPGLAKIPAQYSIVDSSLATPTAGTFREETIMFHDGDLSGYPDRNGYSLLLDFGTVRHLEAIGVAPRAGYSYRSKNFRIRGSNDLFSWTLLHTNILSLTDNKLNHYKLNAVENGADFRYIVLDNVQNLNVSEVWGYSKAMMVEATADANPFANDSVESADAAEGVLVKGKLTCSRDGAASVSVFAADRDFGDSYAQWSANGRRFDVGELEEGATFQTRLAGLGSGLWYWRIFATRGNAHVASQLLSPFAVGSGVILPKAYVVNSNMAKCYDGDTAYWGDAYANVWIVFDLQDAIDSNRARLAGWRIWPRNGWGVLLTARAGAGKCDYGYDPEEGVVDWGVTAWHTNGQKRVYGDVSGVPANIVWESDCADIMKTTVETGATKYFVPYVKRTSKMPRYIRFRDFAYANCSEIELRTTRYSTGTVIYLH